MLKRIFYLSYDFGSLSIHCHEIISNMIKSGVNVEIFMPDNVNLNFHLHSDCILHKIPTCIINNLPADILYQLILNITLLLRMVKRGMPDMIYARQNYMGIFPIFLTRLFNIPYFAEVNGITTESKHKIYNIKSYIKCFFEKNCLKFANIIIVPSQLLKQRVIERYRILSKKIYVVPNGVNEELFCPGEINNMLRNSLGIADSDFLVGFIGSMGQWQGIEVLKEAIQAIAVDPEMNDTKFLIVGDYIKDGNFAKMNAGLGEGQKDISTFIKKNKLEKKVIYRSFVSYEKSADYMNICDLLVAPYTSLYFRYGGGSPMKLYAYLACGKPVIISDLGEFTDATLLKKYNAAFLIPPDNSKALADALIKMKKNKNYRIRLGANARHYVIKERKWLKACKQIRFIYKKIFD